MPLELTPEQIEHAGRLWAEGRSRAECAAGLGLPIWRWDEARRLGQLRHLPRQQGRGGGSYDRQADVNAKPGRAELRAMRNRKAEVQAAWCPEERAYRRGSGVLPADYRPRGGRAWAVEPMRGAVPVRSIEAAANARHW